VSRGAMGRADSHGTTGGRLARPAISPSWGSARVALAGELAIHGGEGVAEANGDTGIVAAGHVGSLADAGCLRARQVAHARGRAFDGDGRAGVFAGAQHIAVVGVGTEDGGAGAARRRATHDIAVEALGTDDGAARARIVHGAAAIDGTDAIGAASVADLDRALTTGRYGSIPTFHRAHAARSTATASMATGPVEGKLLETGDVGAMGQREQPDGRQQPAPPSGSAHPGSSVDVPPGRLPGGPRS